MNQNNCVIPFTQLNMTNLSEVGGKNASLGEMISELAAAEVKVPPGFATTATAFQKFLAQNNLATKIKDSLATLDVDDVQELAVRGKQIREWILKEELPEDLTDSIRTSYSELVSELGDDFAVAVRSSATAEDLPQASFAGQQETLLNVRGIDNVIEAVKEVYASLYNDRAIAYRVHQGFPHDQVALSVGIQRMVRCDLACSGVMFSIDTESGFSDVVFITASYGLGEMVVQGAVNPDEFYVHKPSLAKNKEAIVRKNIGSKAQKMIYDDSKTSNETVKIINVDPNDQNRFCLTPEQVHELATQAVLIEKHYQRPMDIEWGIDGVSGEIFILQARPETVQSNSVQHLLERYTITEQAQVLLEGRSIGQRIGSGVAKIIKSLDQMDRIEAGDVLVTDMTDPDWEPIMKRASAIVTNRGGRTCHAAIIARELGIPAIVGTGNGTKIIEDNDAITVSCAEGEIGKVYKGKLDFEVSSISMETIPDLPVKMMLNVANPERAFSFQSIPNEGIGLARLEFIINNMIGIHPRALLDFDNLESGLKEIIKQKISAYGDPIEYYVERLKEGIATLAAAFYPKPVIVRLSDFKSNEYAHLIGGKAYEPIEENPMLGFRGAGRYVSLAFRDCFALECEAVKRVRENMGLDNVEIMIPFVRTLGQASQVIDLLAEEGLKRGENGLRIIMMCEIPSNAILADEFLEYFDGFSIGSNDLTQLTLGLDRDSELIAEQFDENDPAVRSLMHLAIQACNKNNKYIGICGQGPSDKPEMAQWLLKEGIGSLSLNPDSVIDTMLYLDKQVR